MQPELFKNSGCTAFGAGCDRATESRCVGTAWATANGGAIGTGGAGAIAAFQIAKLMAEQNISKTAMAEQMQTSRAAVDRLLDENNGAATLQTLEKAAIVLGKRLRIELV